MPQGYGASHPSAGDRAISKADGKRPGTTSAGHLDAQGPQRPASLPPPGATTGATTGVLALAHFPPCPAVSRLPETSFPNSPSAPALLSPTARCEGPRKAALTARQRPTALDGARGPHDRLRHDSVPDDGLALPDTSPRLPLTTCHPHTGLTRTCTHAHP